MEAELPEMRALCGLRLNVAAAQDERVSNIHVIGRVKVKFLT